jgi:hypothetical protein
MRKFRDVYKLGETLGRGGALDGFLKGEFGQRNTHPRAHAAGNLKETTTNNKQKKTGFAVVKKATERATGVAWAVKIMVLPAPGAPARDNESTR